MSQQGCHFLSIWTRSDARFTGKHWHTVNGLHSQPQSHISVFISNCLWQSVKAVLASCSWSCFPLPYSLPVGLWLDKSVSKYHTPGTAGLCLQSGDWGRVLLKYCLNNFSCCIPFSRAFPRANFVPESRDDGKDFVWLANGMVKAEGKYSRASDKDHMAPGCVAIESEHKTWPLVCVCLCVCYIRIVLYMRVCMLNKKMELYDRGKDKPSYFLHPGWCDDWVTALIATTLVFSKQKKTVFLCGNQQGNC